MAQVTTIPMQSQPQQPPAQPGMMMMTSTGQGPPVRRLKHRHLGFKCGVGGLALAAVLFIVGYSAPAWAYASSSNYYYSVKTSRNIGLWMSCYGGKYKGCRDNVGGGPGWLDAVRAMETLALVCVVCSLAVELYQDVFANPIRPDNKAVEALGLAAGVFGLVGIIIYGSKLKNPASTGIVRGGLYIYIDWGFGLAAAGLILCIVCSILIAFSRVRHATLTTTALANLGVTVTRAAPPAAFPMQPIAAGYGYPAPAYPYPYPSPYPYPATMAPWPAPPTQGMPTSQITAAQGVSSSQAPACFVMVQGQMVPVYKEMPPTMMTTTLSAAADVKGHTGASTDGQPSQRL